jgi:hypothetical protein
MYRISSDINLSDIIGSEIQQIRLGRYDVQFHFGSGRTICVQSEIEVLEQDAVIATWSEEHNWSSTAFQKLLNASVLNYSVPNDRLLEIEFKGNLVLRLYDSSDQYESMQIYPEGIII